MVIDGIKAPRLETKYTDVPGRYRELAGEVRLRKQGKIRRERNETGGGR